MEAIRFELVELRQLIISSGDISHNSQVKQLTALAENLQTVALRMKAAMDHMVAAQKAQSVANEHLLAAAQEQSEALSAFILPDYPPNPIH